jgi:hypothetical protein
MYFNKCYFLFDTSRLKNYRNFEVNYGAKNEHADPTVRMRHIVAIILNSLMA